MSRVVFLMDKIMRRFGLSGKSVVPLISGTACAIPAIMATRNIENWKERLITILVTPFTTCSARLPVYAIIIGLVIPDEYLLGILNLQGLTLMLLYLLGFGMAILSAYILNKVLQLNCKTFFVVEMPNYKLPMFKNVMITVIEKTKAFVFGAGKIILAISVILWFLASNGPSEKFRNAETIITSKTENKSLSALEIENKAASFKLQNSYIGLMGKTIEPPFLLWVMIGKLVLLLSVRLQQGRFLWEPWLRFTAVGGSDNENTIRNKMATETNAETGEKIFNFASGISLLLFYAFALQCISTLAVTKKETNSWKWPLGQLVFMSSFAYIVALIAYQLLK